MGQSLSRGEYSIAHAMIASEIGQNEWRERSLLRRILTHCERHIGYRMQMHARIKVRMMQSGCAWRLFAQPDSAMRALTRIRRGANLTRTGYTHLNASIITQEIAVSRRAQRPQTILGKVLYEPISGREHRRNTAPGTAEHVRGIPRRNRHSASRGAGQRPSRIQLAALLHGLG